MATTPAATDATALPLWVQALVSAAKLPHATAQELHMRSQAKKTSLVSELLASGKVSASDAAHALARTLSLPLVDVGALDLPRLPTGLLDAKLCQSYRLLVLSKRGNRLTIACADPSDTRAAEKIKLATACTVDWVVAEYDKLRPLFKSGTAPGASPIPAGAPSIAPLSAGLSAPVAPPFATALSAPPAALANPPAFSANPGPTLDAAGKEFKFEASTSMDLPVLDMAPSGGGGDVEDAPVVRFLQKMLLDAFNMRASDLHFEPYEHQYRVRFRIDGELREIANPPVSIKDKLASRIKVISRMDIAEKRVPQDGKMKLMLGDRMVDFRVSTLPTLYGEKIVIRILDPSSAQMGINALGYDADEKQRLLHAIGRPYGMVLVTGPTGSGKTVSLYTCLNLLNQPGVNIATAEDPCEINLPGVNQVNVNEKAGLTFASALKSFLRQDPDIIMVGEIRDLETADISIKAAQTGHLVLSTLHTNDAPTTLTRMRNMGIAPFNIASSVILITAQRLARRLCGACKAPLELPREALLRAGFTAAELDDPASARWTPYRPVGCAACNAGYKGRVGIYQVMPISEEIQRIILRDGNAMEIAAQSEREGVRSLRQSGLQKVRQGLTSLEEVLAVTNE